MALPQASRQEKVDGSLSLGSASCNDIKSGRQNDLLVSCLECFFLLQPRHLQAVLFPRLQSCLFVLSKRIALLPSSIPSCPSPFPLAHLELAGLQGHFERCDGNRERQLDRSQAPFLPWEEEMRWRSIPLALRCPSAPRETGSRVPALITT